MKEGKKLTNFSRKLYIRKKRTKIFIIRFFFEKKMKKSEKIDQFFRKFLLEKQKKDNFFAILKKVSSFVSFMKKKLSLPFLHFWKKMFTTLIFFMQRNEDKWKNCPIFIKNIFFSLFQIKKLIKIFTILCNLGTPFSKFPLLIDGIPRTPWAKFPKVRKISQYLSYSFIHNN